VGLSPPKMVYAPEGSRERVQTMPAAAAERARFCHLRQMLRTQSSTNARSFG
jgi:hypothetical protein